jgi:hypothetical protein
VDPGFFGGDALGFLQGVECFADLAAHGVRLGQVEVVAGLPFRRQAARVDLLGELDGLPGVATS